MKIKMSQIHKSSIVLVTLCALSFAQTGQEIIEKVDNNTVVESSSYRATMIISLGGTIREKRFIGYAEGKERAYMEFTYPARDKGTRFLKIGDEMWMYLPAVEKATKIAGHMLRQSMMGSDFSYDDIIENAKLIELYKVELTGTDTIDGRNCFVLELTAKVAEISYYSRKMWVDKEMFVPVRVELYAKSGKLMKEVMFSEYRQIQDYKFPTAITMVNKLRKDTYTELMLDDIKLDIQIPDRIFTKAYLERK
jgi:outer membrane lipoprotein-sorting protein